LTEQELHTVRDGLSGDPFSLDLNAKIYEHYPLPDESRQLIDFYRQLQRVHPDDWRHLVNLARAYSATGKDSLAVVQLQKLLRTDSSLLEVWMDLALCYQRLKKTELALRAINSAIDIDPAFEEAHLSRVRLLIETQEYQEAAAAVVFSLGCDRLSKPVVEWLEKLDEFLESSIEPPAELVNAMGSAPAAPNPSSS
jgi:tetratricopeptide (TPR) repeat protein